MQVLLRTVPILSAASISTFIIYSKSENKNNYRVIADSETLIDSSQYNSPFQTPEKYLKSMFTKSKSNKDEEISNIEPRIKQMLYSPQVIINTLSKNANTIYPNNNNIFTHYDINQYNANTPIEDTFDVRLKPNTKDLQGSLFGVYDGHSGDACSKFCKAELVEFLIIHSIIFIILPFILALTI